MMLSRLCALFGVILMLVVSAAIAAQPTRVASDREAVEKAMHDYADTLRSGTPEAISLSYTADGELLLPGLPALHGRGAIKDFLTPLAAATEVESVEIQNATLEVNGKTANQWGTYRQVAGAKGQPRQTYEGRYAALWHMDGDGRWRLFRLMMQPMR